MNPHQATPRPYRSRYRLLAATGACLLAAGAGGTFVAATAGASTHATALGDNWYESAPYYSTLDSNGPDLGQVMAATGQKAFEMAFLLADGSSYDPSWDGTDPVSSDSQVGSVIDEVRNDGGDVIVSAGGYNGTKLGQVCASASATAAAYQQVITTYGLHAMDFDLEEPEIENSAAIANELGAAQILQQEDSGLFVSVTMPSTLQDFNGQLMSTFGLSTAQAYAHEGFSGMNGRSDTGEIFTQSDFQTVLSFAQSNGMSRFTFWSVNRDRECNPPDNNGNTSSECSSVTQNPWDFTAYTVAFANGAPVTPPSSPPPSSPPPTSPPPSSCSAAAWSASTTYTSGNMVSYNSHQWTAN